MSPDELLTTPPLGASTADATRIARLEFGISGDATRLPGERDDNFRVSTAEGDYSLKVANPAEHHGVLEMQQLALIHIATEDPDLPVPHPVRTVRGEVVATVQIGPVETTARMVTFLDGVAIPSGPPMPSRLRRIGALLAHLDDALAGFDHPHLDREHLWDVAQMSGIARFAHHLPEEQFEFVTQWLNRFDDQIAPRLPNLPQQAIHSDFNPENLLVDPTDPDRIVGIIDFGDVMRSARVIDPAVAAAYQCFDSADPARTVAEIVAAYHDVRPLAGSEIGMLPDLVMGRLVQSVTIGAWRADLHPENRDYILMHNEPGWTALMRLEDAGADHVRSLVRDACGTAA